MLLSIILIGCIFFAVKGLLNQSDGMRPMKATQFGASALLLIGGGFILLLIVVGLLGFIPNFPTH